MGATMDTATRQAIMLSALLLIHSALGPKLREQAEAMLAGADAYRRGYDDGHEAGYRVGYEEGRRVAKPVVIPSRRLGP